MPCRAVPRRAKYSQTEIEVSNCSRSMKCAVPRRAVPNIVKIRRRTVQPHKRATTKNRHNQQTNFTRHYIITSFDLGIRRNKIKTKQKERITNRQTSRHKNNPNMYVCVCMYIYIYMYFFFFWLNSPQWVTVSSFTRFLDHNQGHTTVGRTPLDK